jgi:iron complex outermembrane receptor protein
MTHSRTSVLGLMLAATCMTHPAFAQTAAPPAAGQLEEIVVTARKSSENLQQVPLAITALTADTLAKGNTKEIRDIATLTPGLSIGGNGSESGEQPSIRGLSFTGDASSEGNVAVMLDGIYIANPGALSMGMMDIARVEVVKGPQSAAYGHSAFGGAINYVPVTPPKEFGGSAQVGGATYGSYNAKISLGGPVLSDIITAKGGFSYDKEGGTYTDAVNGKSIGGYEKKDADLLVRIQPKDWMTYDIGFYYGDDNFGLPMQVAFPNNCAPNATTGVFSQYCGALPSGSTLKSLMVAPTLAPSQVTGNDREVRHVRIKATYDLPLAKVELSGGYFDVKDNFYTELFGVRDGLSFPLAGTPAGNVNVPIFSGGALNNTDYSGELRISSKEGGKLHWAAGAYYYSTDQLNRTDFALDGELIPAGRTISCLAAVSFACGLITPNGAPASNPGLAIVHNHQTSAFASVAYDFTSKLSLSAEARYTDEHKFANTLSVITAPGTDPDGPNGQSADFKYWDPRFTADYKLTTDNLLYASAAKGTKSGGFNTRAINADELAYNPENNWTYEIGSKNTFFNRRLRVNLAAFYSNWTDLQILVPSENLNTIGSVTKNYGSMKAMGGELEVAARLATGVNFSTGVAYTDPRFGNDTYDFANVALCRLIPSCAPNVVTANSPRGPLAAVKLGGTLREYVSQWQYTAGLDVDRPLVGVWSWFASGNYKYESAQFTQLDDFRYIGARNTLTLRAGVREGSLRFSLWANNALNDLTPLALSAGQGITRYNNALQVPKASMPDQRRVGGTIDYSF